MKSDNPKFFPIDNDSLISFYEAMKSADDRASALLAGSLVESALLHAIECVLVQNPEDDFQDAAGPVSTFSQRITIAYYLGLICDPTRRDLRLIKSIRDQFAHEIDTGLSFKSQWMRNKIRALRTVKMADGRSPEEHARMGPRWVFTAAVMNIVHRLQSIETTRLKKRYIPIERLPGV